MHPGSSCPQFVPCRSKVFLWVIRKSISSTTNHGRALMRINLFTSGDGYQRQTFHGGWSARGCFSPVELSHLCVILSWRYTMLLHVSNMVARGFRGYTATMCLVLFMERGGDEQAVESAFLFWVTHLVTVAPRHPRTAFFWQYMYYFYRTSFLVTNQKFLRDFTPFPQDHPPMF